MEWGKESVFTWGDLMSFPRDAEKPIGDDGLGHEKLAEAIVLEHGCVGWEEISKTVKGAIAWRRGA